MKRPFTSLLILKTKNSSVFLPAGEMFKLESDIETVKLTFVYSMWMILRFMMNTDQ